MIFQTDFPIIYCIYCRSSSDDLTDCHRYIDIDDEQTTAVMLYGAAFSWNEAEHGMIGVGWRILFE